MGQSRKLLSFVVLFIMSLSFTLSSVNLTVHADTRYTVQRGNTLWGIARAYHTSVTDLMENNHLNTTLLQIHQSLRIPSPDQSRHSAPYGSAVTKQLTALVQRDRDTFHVVRPGDTLWAIAENNHISVRSLMEINNLNSTVIYPGQKLEVHGNATRTIGYKNSEDVLQNVSIRNVALKEVPEQLIPVYKEAGRQYDIPWTVLAAIHKKETNFSTKSVVSYAGAEGPMQFMPSTFKEYGVTAPECHGAPDINNVYDAIYTAAHMLAVDGYSKNPAAAIYQYNHSIAYVNAVRTLSQKY